jgi:hypothetical protein
MMKHALFSLLALSPLFLQASRSDPDYEQIFLDEDECTLEEILEEEIADAKEKQTDLVVYAEDPAKSSSQQKQTPLNQSVWFAFGEFLWWKLDETGLDYAVHKKQGTAVLERGPPTGALNSGAVDGLVGKVHRINFDWNPGFRAALGYRFPRDLWELSGIYTYYFTSDSDHVNASHFYPDSTVLSIADAEIITPTIDPALNDVVIGARASGHFWYHIADVELARQFKLTDYIALRFFVGPTAAWIQQKFHVVYFDQYFTNPTPIGTIGTFATPSQYSYNDFNWRFEGAGIKLGVDSSWKLGYSFNLLCGAAFSSIYGSYKSVTKAHDEASHVPGTFIPGSVGGLINDATFRQGRVIYGARLKGGLEWVHRCRCWDWSVYAKYELNTWFNLTDQYRPDVINQVFPHVRVLQTPPLNLQGLTAGLAINF